MYFNYGYERRLFEQDQTKKKREYLKTGMSEEAIREMYEYDLNVFNNERKEIKHRAHYSEMLTYDAETGDSRYMDMDEFPSKIEHIDYSLIGSKWLEDIENPYLYKALSNLPKDYITIIGMKMDGYTDEEVGDFFGVKRKTINNKILRVKKLLTYFI